MPNSDYCQGTESHFSLRGGYWQVAMPQWMTPQPYTYEHHYWIQQVILNHKIKRLEARREVYWEGEPGKMNQGNQDRYNLDALCTPMKFSKSNKSIYITLQIKFGSELV